jgi:hypothetical protein
MFVKFTTFVFYFACAFYFTYHYPIAGIAALILAIVVLIS